MNNTSGGGGDGGNNGDNGDVLNWVALVVSLVALLGTVAQVLQQYYASAAGFANCGESVMGEWYKSSKRIFRPTELRFEVQFDAPVIFVCPPTNRNGPVKGVPICYVDGTERSLKGTRTLSPGEEEKQRGAIRENRVHTADNERATWVTLLSQMHHMERESREWQRTHYGTGYDPDQEPEVQKPDSATADDLPPPALKKHTFAVAVQSKQRSWDTMPTDVKKPYATTTICHLLEIAAMMSIYWKEFDRSKDRYRAEGNGYILTGSQITDLGLTFTFQISGGSRFQENRVIPADEVKEMCCGTVSTLFRADKDSRRLGMINEDPRDLGQLQLGSMNEIAETMVLMDCNTKTANYFRMDNAKHGHLFPVPFELLGMLSKSLYIEGTPFRMLPNPTPYHWDTNFFNLRKLIEEYYKKIEAIEGIDEVDEIKELARGLVKALTEDKRLRDEERRDQAAKRDELLREKQAKEAALKAQKETDRLEKVAVDKQPVASDVQEKPVPSWLAPIVRRRPRRQGPDEENATPTGADKGRPSSWRASWPTQAWGRKTESPPPGGGGKPPLVKTKPGYSMQLLKILDECLVSCDNSLTTKNGDLVRAVLREHFQEVLKMINDDDDEDPIDPDTGSSKTKTTKPDDTKSRKTPRFEDLSAASPEDRQKLFMEIYFTDVLNEVTKRAFQSYGKLTTFRHDTMVTTPMPPGSVRSSFMMPKDLTESPTSPLYSPSEGFGGPDVRKEDRFREKLVTAIWCRLVFRMLCWLTLHDFDKKDVQISKSELLGSRLPVYIS